MAVCVCVCCPYTVNALRDVGRAKHQEQLRLGAVAHYPATGKMAGSLPPPEVLEAVLRSVTSATCVVAACVSRDFAAAAEIVCKERCAAQRLRPPRRPRGRGAAAAATTYPFRTLLARANCRSCGGRGVFGVRAGIAHRPSGLLAGAGPPPLLFLLCRRCTLREDCQRRLQALDAHVDLVGVTGERLIGHAGSGAARRPAARGG